ncbi:MAG: hypothetical protein HZC04_00935 [Candidatus Lloydbacteria bacterium]|nr:hypothetical protein [Candidatus Lloydbacteria bacterium]
MNKTSNTESESPTIACREARLLLPGMGMRAAERDGFSTEEVSAYQHYLGCSECTELGMSSLARVPMTCQRAAEIAASAIDQTGLFFDSGTVLETAAREHIYGRGFKRTSFAFGSIYKRGTACTCSLCKKIAQYWCSIPFSSSYDGDTEGVKFLPRLISWFYELSLPLDVLFEIQEKEIKKMISSAVRHAEKEAILLHVEILQGMVLEKKEKKPKKS